MHKALLSNLLDEEVISEGELRLLIDITKDRWNPAGHDIPFIKFSNIHNTEFILDSFIDEFNKTISLFFEKVEEELNIPLLNFIENDLNVIHIKLLYKRPKERIKNIISLNKYIKLKEI